MSKIMIENNRTVVRVNGREVTLPGLKQLNESQDGLIAKLKEKGLISGDVIVNRSYH